MYLYDFICLSVGALEWESSRLSTTLLHHVPLNVTSVLVLFIIFGGLFQYMVYMYAFISFLTISVVFPIVLIIIACVMFTIKDPRGNWLWVLAYSPIVFIFLSVDVNVLIAEDDQLFLTLVDNFKGGACVKIASSYLCCSAAVTV